MAPNSIGRISYFSVGQWEVRVIWNLAEFLRRWYRSGRHQGMRLVDFPSLYDISDDSFKAGCEFVNVRVMRQH